MKLSAKFIPSALKIKKDCNRSLMIVICFVLLFSIFMISSASIGTLNTDAFVIIKPIMMQIMIVGVCFFAMNFVTSVFSMDLYDRLKNPIIILTLFGCLLTLVFPTVNGSKAWISLGPITIQPSEFCKINLILLFASEMRKGKKGAKNFWDVLKVPTLYTLACAFIILIMQYDLGSAAVMIAIYLCLVLICDHPEVVKIK
ncbi:MAG: FtsW/RodA/SpoVE family cell cycle protein, partial [Erysipelotrichaceae bacterium]